MSLRGIKLVTFDATNTLLKFRVPPLQHYVAVARELGHNCDIKDLELPYKTTFEYLRTRHPNFGYKGILWRHWWRTLVLTTFRNKMSDDELEDLADRLIEDYSTSKCWCLADGCERILNTIRKQGIALGVISNYDPRLYSVLESMNILNYFNFIVASYEAGYAKPDEEIFHTAMDMSLKNLKPSQIVHIGDDYENDYEGAKEVRWHAILINNDNETPPDVKHVFKNLNDLSEAIENNTLVL